MEERLAAVEGRLAAVEDELAIIRLIAGYGPKVDCGLPEPAALLFAPDGVYDIELGTMHSRQAFFELLDDEAHQQLVEGGVAHVMGLPMVTVKGDRATAINPTTVFTMKDGEYHIWRVAQNIWELERIGGEWQIVYRTNRLVKTGGKAPDMLRKAFG